MADSFHDIIRSQTDIWLAEIQKVFQYYISRTTVIILKVFIYMEAVPGLRVWINMLSRH